MATFTELAQQFGRSLTILLLGIVYVCWLGGLTVLRAVSGGLGRLRATGRRALARLLGIGHA